MRSLGRWGVRYADVLVVLAALLAVFAYWSSQRPSRQFAAALAEVGRKDWDAVRIRAARLEQSRGYFPHAQLLWGVCEIQDGQFTHALEDLHASAQHQDTRPLALAYAGEAWFKMRQFKPAEQNLLAALKLDPSRADTHRWLASLYYDTGAMEHALVHLTRVAELDATDARPHRLMGLINNQYEQYAPAIDNYRESLRRNPNQPDRQIVLLELAQAQVKVRNYAAALETLRTCQVSSEQRVLEAECHFALGDRKQAKVILAEVLSQAPNRPDALMLLGGILLEEGLLPEATDVLSRCVEANPVDYAARFRLSQAHQRAGNQSEAERHGKIAEEIQALRLHFIDLHHQAIAQPHDAEVRYQLGVTAGQLQRLDLARNWFQSALALNPTHRQAAEALQALSVSPGEDN
jgi:tetratricopeptide (TPR) repeat protein